MVFAGVKRIDKPIQADSELASISTKAEEKAAEKAPVVDTEEKPKRRRKK